MFGIKKNIKKLLGEYWTYRLKLFRDRVFNNSQNDNIDVSFYSSFIKKGDLCFDVGANIGNKVDMLMRVGARVVAIEPQESCYRILKYKYGNKISLVNKGVGEAVETKEFHISSSNTISSFSTEWINAVKKSRFRNDEWNKTISVPMTTLDRLILEFGVPNYIKIDVEGYELEVLKGLNSSVPLISFEYTIPERLERVYQCLYLIERLNTNIVCNYTEGEQMKLILPQWLKIEEFKEVMLRTDFSPAGFGDIFIKSVS
jgi:FkbM family methyltransferase